jgi:hypothetical protein
MLDQAFCETLEYKLCDAFENSDDENLKGFWCDGVLLSEDNQYYTQKFVNDNRHVKMKAFVGKDGQKVYGLTLFFGSKALSRYARNLDMTDCIPATDYIEWFKIDVEKKEIEVSLE